MKTNANDHTYVIANLNNGTFIGRFRSYDEAVRSLEYTDPDHDDNVGVMVLDEAVRLELEEEVE